MRLVANPTELRTAATDLLLALVVRDARRRLDHNGLYHLVVFAADAPQGFGVARGQRT